MKVMKKLMILVILLTAVVGCELFDAKTWEESDKRLKEKGYRCVEAYDDGYTKTPAKCGYY